MAAALTATLGLAAASWGIAVWQMHGMDMGVATRLGSFASFIAVWVVMMAAMMLPGAGPAVLRRAQAGGGVRASAAASSGPTWPSGHWWAPRFTRCTGRTGLLPPARLAIAAGVYELTPLKQHFRRRCRGSVRSGFRFGLCCAGSSIGLMAILVAVGVMSVTWMSVVAILVLAQKLMPPKAAVDVPLALAIVGLGIGSSSRHRRFRAGVADVRRHRRRGQANLL
jgi:predicted metal-binding membrane protein